nr:TOPRIM nucleotidyl transferase/hydrolase domain-containing protein [Clostridium perfringens]
MNEINSNYELDGGYILQVNGTYFKTYFDAFKDLNIKIIVKTDNDLRASTAKNSDSEYELLGINRCLGLIGEEKNKI